MIKLYKDSYFNSLSNITTSLWKGEVEMDTELISFIYPFLVRFYSYINKYSYVLEENEIKAFLLCYRLCDTNNAKEYFYNKINSLNVENKNKAITYLNYLEYNQKKIKEYMNNNSLCIGLLASVIPGGGTKLIKKLIKDAKDNNIDNIYLWTDETCNYSYYEKFSFKVVEEYYVKFFDKVIRTYIYMLDLKK